MPNIFDQMFGNTDQSQSPNIAQQILANRDSQMSTPSPMMGAPQMQMPPMQMMTPSLGTNMQADTANMIGRMTSPDYYRPITPQELMMQQAQTQNLMLQGQGEAMKNQIMAQTGMPMAQEQLKELAIKNDIAQATGMNAAQADIAYKQAMAGQANDQVNRFIQERNYEYQNNPEMMQARAMANLLGSAGNAPQNGNIPQQMQNNANGSIQPQTGPLVNRGAILGKMGLLSPGQAEEDKNFSQSWQTYNSEGGDKRLQNSLDTIDQVIQALKDKKIETGGIGSRAMTNPEGTPMMGMQLINPDAMVARNLISSAILPQAKALFGSRVTNFDAQSLISSQGLDPMADTDTNIAKLEKLRNATVQAQKELNASGKYFQQNGTLSGYQGLQNQSNEAAGLVYIPGMIRNGYKFNGGDSTKKENWSAVQ